MSDDYRIQASFRTQLGAMINVRANTAEEFDAELAAVSARIAQFLSIEQQLFGAATVAAALPLAPQQPLSPPPAPQAPAPAPFGAPQSPAPGFPAAPPQPQVPMQQQASVPPAAAASPGAGQAPVCQHNLPAKWVPGGVSRSSGKPYQGFWACPLDREQQCKMPR